MKKSILLLAGVVAWAGCATTGLQTTAPSAGAGAATPAGATKAEVAAVQTVDKFEAPVASGVWPGSGPLRGQYDWFRNLWRTRRTAWAASVAQDQGALVFLGDSITQGWDEGGRKLADFFPGAKVANRGISGDTTRGVLIRLADDVVALHPRGVVLLIGTNDLEEGAEPWTVAANVRAIIDALRVADPRMPVVLCQVLPSAESKKRPAGKILRVNQLYKEVVRDQPQVTLLDTWTLFANADGDAKLEEMPDLLHPNAAGYAKWVAALRPALATLGFLETTADEFSPEPGFVSLFNGRDLTGWGYRPTGERDREWATKATRDASGPAWPIVDAAEDFSGRTTSPDGRFVALNGRLVVTTPVEFRKIQQLWTTQEFPRNFVLRLEFRATPNTDSGVYVRGPQLQCRDYLLAGPYKALTHYRPQQWNELEITVVDGKARCVCNGEVLEEAMPVPASGPIGVEGDRGQMEYRRIRLKELP